jgi:hypothetical protein
MEGSPQNGPKYQSAAECVRFARQNLSDVKGMLSRPTPENAERSGDLLRDVEVQLGCAAAFLRSAPDHADPKIVTEIHELKRQTESLVVLFAETNRVLAGWASRVLVNRNGYAEHGGAAPLFLVGKNSAEG